MSAHLPIVSHYSIGKRVERVNNNMNTIPVENRRLMIIEQALSINNYIDCDVIQDEINEVQNATTLENIIMHTIDLKNAIAYRGASIKGIDSLLTELESIHIKNLIGEN